MSRRFTAVGAALGATVLLAALPLTAGHAATGGQDAGGYSYTDSTEAGGPAGGPFASIAPADGGSGTDLGNHCDDCTTTYELPFTLSFYDKTATEVQVSSNGNIQLGSSSRSSSTQDLPDDQLDTVIEGYYKDLRTDGDGNGIFVQTTGAPGHRVLTVEWRTVLYVDESTAEDFQVVLHEDSRSIEMHYLDVPTRYSDGVVGIQDGDGSGGRYLQYAGALSDGLAVQFSRNEVSYSTSTALSVRPVDRSVHGQAVRLAAKVAPVSSSGTAPTGTVTFFDGALALGTVPVGADGDAGLSTASLSTGSHQLMARYDGDSDYRASSSTAIDYTVARASTATTVTVPKAGTVRYGDRGVSAQVRTRAPGRGTPTGSVSWFDNGSLVTRTSLTKGRTTLPSTALEPGDHQLTATYAGNGDSVASSSDPVALTVTKADRTVTVKVSPRAPRAGQQVTVTATATTSSKAVPSSGNITFAVDGEPVGSNGQGGGSATIVLEQGLTTGIHAISATFTGSDEVADATGSVTLTVR